MIAHNAIDGTVVAVFVESVHDVAPGVILEWLTSTATILAGEIVHRDERRSDPFRVPSDGIVRFFAREAACQYIARRCSFHGDYFKNLALVRDVLTAITALSRTSEERKLPSGELLIASADGIADLDIVVEFGTEKPSLVHAKHTAKLLQAVRHSSLRLLCKSDMEVVGIAGPGAPPDNSICVRLDSGRAKVWVREEHVCNIQHGDFVAGIELQIASLQRAIQGAGDEASHLLQLVESVLRSASRRRHGCTVVLDLRRDPVPLSGHTLKSPLKLRNGETAFEVAAGLASIDGAVHIDKEGNLCAFGCLLDGEAVEHEQRSRGARYNSALRFCKTHKNVIVVVLSEDGHLSVFSTNGEVTASHRLTPLDYYLLESTAVGDWLAE
jgi:hypothetical protein